MELLNKGIISMGHARALVGKSPEEFNKEVLNKISNGKISVRDLESNKQVNKSLEPNLVHEEKNLSQTIGFKTKISYKRNGQGTIKIFFSSLEQYNFIINKLKN